MTQLSLNQGLDLSIAGKVERLVAQNRANTPASALDRRQVRRMSIAEMNATDLDSLLDNFRRVSRDDRGPVTRFLDLVDLPRNVVANVVFGDIARKKSASGERGAFGLGRVMFSDALKEMGVSNGIVRGVAGFVGDVVMDPLTYLGGTGAAIRVVTKAGGRAIVGRAGAGALRRSIKSVSRGGDAIDDVSRAVLEGATGGRLDVLRSAGDPRRVSQLLSRRLYGDARIAPESLGDAIKAGAGHLAKGLGFDESTRNGFLARTIGQTTNVVTSRGGQATNLRRATNRRAMDDFLQKYGKGAAPGVHFGRDASGKLRVVVGGRGAAPKAGVYTGSTVAHIPFAELGIHVPGITADALAARRVQRMATGIGIGAVAASTPRLAESLRGLQDVRGVVEEGLEAERAYEAAAGPLRAIVGQPNHPGRFDAESRLADLTADHRRSRMQRAELLQGAEDPVTGSRSVGLLQKLRDITHTTETAKAENIGDVLALKRVVDEATALSRHYAASAGDAADQMRVVAEPYTKAQGQAKRFAAVYDALTDSVDGKINRPVFVIDPARPGEVTINADPRVQHAVAQRLVHENLLERLDDGLRRVDALEASADGIEGSEAIRSQSLFEGQTQALGARAQAAAEVEAIRDRIQEVTAPLRIGKQQTVEEAAAEVRSRVLAGINGVSANLLQTAENDLPRMQAIVDNLHAASAAALEYAHAVRGSAVQLAQQHPLGPALDVTKVFLNTTDDLVATSILAPLASAARAVTKREDGVLVGIADSLDQAFKTTFGTRGGTMNRVINHFRFARSQKAQLVIKSELSRQLGEIREIANRFGLPETSVPELSALAMARAHESAQAGGKTMFWSTRLDGSPDPMVELLLDARKNGLLNEQLRPGITAAIDEYAARNADMMKSLADTEMANKILGNVIPDYIPRQETEQAGRFIGSVMRQAIQTDPNSFDAARATSLGQILEPFQYPRTLVETRFKSERLGRDVSFLEADRWIMSRPASEIALLPDPDKRRYYEDLRNIIEEYDSMPNPPPGYTLSPWEVNRRVAEGDLSMLLGSTSGVPTGFLDTSMASAMASRLGQHERAVARASFRSWLEQPGVAIVDNRTLHKFTNALPGEEVPLGNGAVGRVVRLAREGVDDPGTMGIRIGSDVFRPLDRRLRTRIDNPLMDAMGEVGRGAIYHDNVARKLENVAKVYDDEQTTRQLLRFYDTFNAHWKGLTLLHPSWTLMNMIGDSMNMLAGGVRVQDMIKNIGPAIKFVRHMRDDAKLADIVFRIGDQTVTAAQLKPMLSEARIIDANLFADTTAQLLARGHRIMPSARGAAMYAPDALRSDWVQAYNHRAVSGFGARSKPGEALGATADVFSDRYIRTVLSPWMTANQRLSDAMRTLGYVSFRAQGYDHAEAASATIRAVFDYSDVTAIEAGLFRRLFPFYSWMRNNGAYQLKTLLQRPMYVGAVPLFQRAIEEAIADDQSVPQHMRPNWMREQLAIQVGKDPNDRFAVMLGSAIPQEGVLALGQALGGPNGLREFANYFTSSLSPSIRTALEIGAGREFFSDRTIGGDKAMNDLTYGEVLANQARPIREIPRVVKAFGETGVGGGVARLLLGGRVQPFTGERVHTSKAREYREEESRLRTAISRAEFRGDDSKSIQYRARLMRLYEAMLRDGHQSDVPKWAAEQLGALLPSPT